MYICVKMILILVCSDICIVSCIIFDILGFVVYKFSSVDICWCYTKDRRFTVKRNCDISMLEQIVIFLIMFHQNACFECESFTCCIFHYV